MWDAVLCIVIIGGFFVLRGVLATVVFFYLLPEGDRCPNCNAVTIRVQSRWINYTMRRFRTGYWERLRVTRRARGSAPSPVARRGPPF